MKFPKQSDMMSFMGSICRFKGSELTRTYLKKKVIKNSPKFPEFNGYGEHVPVRWKSGDYPRESVGWIIGFGFCFDGTICQESELGDSYKFFRASKRINYVRVRITPMGKEIKVLAKNITEVKPFKMAPQ